MRRTPFLLALLCPALAGWTQPLVVARNGEAEARLVTASEGLYGEVIEDLQRVLYAMTAAVVQVTHGKPEPGTIFVGTRDEALSLNGALSLPELEEEEILLFQDNGCLYLLAGGKLGVSHAVYRWLHKIGCRWFMPGAMGEHIPSCPVLRVKPFRHRHKPSFSMRTLWYAFGANSPVCAKRFQEWGRRNAQGAYPRIAHGHNFNHLLPEDKWFEEHPEYYALLDGKRDPEQLCTSSPEATRAVIDQILHQFEARPQGPHTVSLCPNDSNDFCDCPVCKKLDGGRRDPFDPRKPCYTDRLMVFWNAVAEGVSAKFPDATLSFYAYVSHTAPPEREPIHPNLAPFFTTQQFCVLHSIADEACESRQLMRRMLSRYCELNDWVHIYEYDPPVGHLDVPSPMYANHAESLPLYRDMGVKGFSMECHDSWATTSPSLWIDAQLQWDVDQEVSNLMESYFQNFFAEAKRPIAQYYRVLEGCYDHEGVHEGWSCRSMEEIYTMDDMRQMRAALDKALAAVKTPLTRKRVQMIDLGFQYLEAHRVLAMTSDSQDYKAAMDAFHRACDVLDICYATNEEYILATQPKIWLERKRGLLAQYLPESRAFQEENVVWTVFPGSWQVLFETEGGDCPPDWADVNFDDSAWHTLKPNEMWHSQVDSKFTGRAWGRCTFKAPQACKDQALNLFVGSLDERGRLYLNGELIHVRTGEEEQEGWTSPFVVEVAGKVKAGQDNTFAVAAEAEKTVGGLWRPIWLYSPK